VINSYVVFRRNFCLHLQGESQPLEKKLGYKESRNVQQAESESIRYGVREVVGPTLQGYMLSTTAGA